MATAEQFYVDPSALVKLYLREAHSREMAAWRGKLRGSLPLTHHGQLEVRNALGLALHRSSITPAMHEAALIAFADDLTQGRNRVTDIGWRTVHSTATEISRLHTPAIGCRTLDVLHVACALEMDLRRFVTYDQRQAQLAKAIGLRVVTPH